MKLSITRTALALVSSLSVSIVHAQQTPAWVATFSSHISDYFNPSPDWPIDDPNEFGASVAMRNETAAVGMPAINENRGRVAIFQRSSSGWRRTGTLVAADAAPGQRFGRILTSREDTLVVGASNAAYVFKLINGAWQQTQKLTLPSAHTGLIFPASLSYQNNLLVAGATSSDGTTSAVYLFQLSAAGKFVQRTRLLSPGGPSSDRNTNDRFGASISMTSAHLLVGAPGAGASSAGAAYLYARTSTSWRLQQKLTASDPQTWASFGESVAINNGVIAIGASGADDVWDRGYASDGAVYVFAPSAGRFVQQKKLSPPSDQSGATFAWFGDKLAMSNDRLVVTAYEEPIMAPVNPFGAAFIYRINGGEAQLTGAVRGEFIHTPSIGLANNWLLVGNPQEYEPLFYPTFGYAEVYDIDQVSCSSLPVHWSYWPFDSTADDLQPVSGSWSVSNGSYGNSGSGAFVASLVNRSVGRCYSVHADVFLSWTGGPANRGGLLYDYQDENNYREATLSRTSTNLQLITLTDVRHGARHVVGTKEAGAWRPGERVSLSLERSGDVTTVRILGSAPLEVSQPARAASSRVGLLATWNLVRFDDLSIGATH